MSETIDPLDGAWWDADHVLWLLTPDAFKTLPDGTILTDIFGKQVTKGVHGIDMETRGGVTAYGLWKNQQGHPRFEPDQPETAIELEAPPLSVSDADVEAKMVKVQSKDGKAIWTFEAEGDFNFTDRFVIRALKRGA